MQSSQRNLRSSLDLGSRICGPQFIVQTFVVGSNVANNRGSALGNIISFSSGIILFFFMLLSFNIKRKVPLSIGNWRHLLLVVLAT